MRKYGKYSPEEKRIRAKIVAVRNGIIERCTKTSSKNYASYGGRGITICEDWLQSPQSFIDWCLSVGYKEGLQIDRINNNDGYFPDNCRFVTPTENSRNRRDNRLLVAFGETKCIQAWVDDKRCCVNKQAVQRRIGKGWEPERAITTPPFKPSGETVRKRREGQQRREHRESLRNANLKKCTCCQTVLPSTAFSERTSYCKPCKARYASQKKYWRKFSKKQNSP